MCRTLLQGLQHFRILREAAGLMLGVDEFALQADVEDPPSPLDEFRVHLRLLLDGGRQTGGLG